MVDRFESSEIGPMIFIGGFGFKSEGSEMDKDAMLM